MAWYEYICDRCAEYVQVKRPMTDPEERPACPNGDGPMRRLYGVQGAIIQRSVVDYLDMAYRGEEPLAGMSMQQTRAIMDSHSKSLKAGRRNNVRTTRHAR